MIEAIAVIAVFGLGFWSASRFHRIDHENQKKIQSFCYKAMIAVVQRFDIRGLIPELDEAEPFPFWRCLRSNNFQSTYANDFRVVVKFSGREGIITPVVVIHVSQYEESFMANVYRFKNGAPYLSASVDVREQLVKEGDITTKQILSMAPAF